MAQENMNGESKEPKTESCSLARVQRDNIPKGHTSFPAYPDFAW